jgi:hypothetical protein
MVTDLPSESPDELPDPNTLIDKRFLSFAILECSDELIDPLIMILRKYLGRKPMTEEEHTIALILAEEAIIVDAEDRENHLGYDINQ